MEKKKGTERAPERLTNAFRCCLLYTFRCAHMPPIPSDVQGWYTGMDEDGGRPVQDADDL